MAIVLGLDAKLFRGEAGTQATIEVTNVKDVSLTLESGEADVTTRAAQGWKLSAATLKEASLEINILYDTEDEDFIVTETADVYPKIDIVGTETGILHRLRRENPGKTFHPADGCLVCPNMKKTTPQKMLESLETGTVRVEVPEETARKARRAIDAMLAAS